MLPILTDRVAAERAAFDRYLRTGHRAPPLELKFNPYHDPETGEFTTAEGAGMASDAVDEAQLTPGAILRGVGIAAGATTDVPALIVQNIVGFPTASDDVPPYALAGDKPKKLTKPNITGKEGAKDVPSWARGERPNVGESGKDFADRLVGAKYGKGYKKGVGSDWSKIKKWADRSFIDPSEG